MSTPKYTNTFVNGQKTKASDVNTNFTDVINSMTDGNKDFNVGELNVGGVLYLSGKSFSPDYVYVETDVGDQTIAVAGYSVIFWNPGESPSGDLLLTFDNTGVTEGQELVIINQAESYTDTNYVYIKNVAANDDIKDTYINPQSFDRFKYENGMWIHTRNLGY